MIHIVPILCLIIFVFFLEVRIKHDFIEVRQEFRALKGEILKNREKIKENRETISKMNG